MKYQSAILFVMALALSQTAFISAQIVDTATPTDTATEPIIEPEADTIAPGFVSIATGSAGETDATIAWTTDELAYGYVEYGETMAYGLKTAKSTTASMDGNASLINLKPGTTYNFRIVAEDESGNVSHSENRTLETAVEVVAADNVLPEISEVSIASITSSGATVSWITDELAQGKVEYGKTVEYGSASSLADDYTTEHSVGLSGLEANTEYHYRVVAQDESDNAATSPDEVFTTGDIPATASPTPATSPAVSVSPTASPTTSPTPTPTSSPTASPTANPSVSPSPSPSPTPTASPAPAVSATPTPSSSSESTSSASVSPAPATTPVEKVFSISGVETVAVTASAVTIIWNTNEAATAQVFYGPGEKYASSSAWSTIKVTAHEVKLTGLQAGTNYFYKIVSQNASGITVSKAGFEFNTLFKKKTVAAPKIAKVRVVSIGETSASIVFDTDVSTTGIVNYGVTTGYEETDGGHRTLLTDHSHPLSGLSPDTLYNFEIVVRDPAGNQTVYQNVTFTTLASSISTPSRTSAPSSGGDGGYSPSKNIAKPTIIKADPLNGQILFIWHASAPTSGLRTLIIRTDIGYLTTPHRDQLVYEGNSGRFSDAGLSNGKKYFYSIFRIDKSGQYSTPLYFAVVPKENKDQANIIAKPSITQRVPIYTFSKELSLGDQNKQVEHLQVLLASEPSIYPKGFITGYFDSLTKEAVKNFQKRHKVNVTGVANMATLRKLEKLSSIEVVNDKAATHDKALSRDLKLGLTGNDVSILQTFLVNAGVYPEALVTGYFGRLTRAALQRFQKEQNISPPAGYFGPITKKRILNLIRLRSVSF